MSVNSQEVRERLEDALDAVVDYCSTVHDWRHVRELMGVLRRQLESILVDFEQLEAEVLCKCDYHTKN